MTQPFTLHGSTIVSAQGYEITPQMSDDLLSIYSDEAKAAWTAGDSVTTSDIGARALSLIRARIGARKRNKACD